MKVKRFELTGTDGWPAHVLRLDYLQDGVMVRTWSSDGRLLEPTPDGMHLRLASTGIQYILPGDEGDED